MKIPKYIIQNTKFIKLDARKPRRDPVAAFNARLWFVESYIISPTKAPTNGPIITPNGIGARIPIINPMFVPQTP
jgi:hypothetical protein